MPPASPRAEYHPDEVETPASPVNWLTLTPDEARNELIDLDRWVDFLRITYGLPPTILPPYWHRHDELIWELSALHLHWLNSYAPDAPLSAPINWHHDFTLARTRLRDWVALNGTRLDRDRPTRTTTWPGEPTPPVSPEVAITDRAADFQAFLTEDHAQRLARHQTRA
ncbi:hypothetical protein [Nocardioides sambongensis]|uniref:hypothetical protein n=1 Tax=Nocardioides sambongensis TaxID=2589074 RepID=UPI001127B89A|nr:hypothetical protein [Nocardioides sambongensis]